MRIESGTTDQYVYFVAVDATDLSTRETGLSSFTVYRSRNGAAAAAMTTPTINETDTTNMPGVYELLLDEDMTIGAGNTTEEMAFHITHAGMNPVTLSIELFTLATTADAVWDEALSGHTTAGSAGKAVADIEVDTGTTLDGKIDTIDTNVDAVLVDTGTTLPASIATIDSNVDAILVDTSTTLDGKLDDIQTSVGNLSTGSGGVSTPASAFVKVGAEPETNTYTSTAAQDGTFHIVEDDATATDFYYQFDVGPDGVPQSVEWYGYGQSQGDSYGVYFYNWASTSFDQVFTLDATNSSTPITETFVATTAHVGTGANDGLVRLRFNSSDGTALATDRILCTYTVIAGSLGYEGGYVWVDEVAGTSTGTAAGTDGLVTNRSDDFDNAQTIAAALGYTGIAVTHGNTITLSATINNFTVGMQGSNWTLALGGQDIGLCDINGADVTGIATGTNPHFHKCLIGAVTLPPCELHYCGIGESSGTLTVGSAGAFRLIDCYSDVAGSGAPVFDLAAVGATTVEFRRWSGGLTLNNVAVGDVISVDVISGGTITVNGTGGTVAVRGMCNVVDGSGGSVTITETSTINMTKINTEVDTAISDASLATAAALATVDTNVDAVLVDTGTTVPAQISALNDISVADVWTSALTESYAADGADGTATQLLYLIQQYLTEKAISGTTVTIKKLDGAATAATLTLDDGTTPTSATRAT